MVKIGVCSADLDLIPHLCQMLLFWAETACAQVQFRHWPCLAELSRSQDCDGEQIMFLDAEDGSADLFETAATVREYAPGCDLISLSGDAGFAIRSYSLHPIGFLEKPVTYQRLARVMDLCLPALQPHLRWIDLPYHRTKTRLLLCELECAEACGRYCTLHCVRGVLQATCSLGELEAMLPPSPFLRCQKSYIVNLRYVHQWKIDGFCMENGATIPIGKNYASPASERYAAYVERGAGA